MDAGDGVLFGQHALAYAVLAFLRTGCTAASCGSRSWLQALHVLVLLAAASS